MAEETTTAPPPHGGGSPLQKGERWVGKHKVIALGGGGLLAFLLLSQRGKNVTIPGTVIQANPTPEGTGADGGGDSTDDTPPESEIDAPAADPTPTSTDPVPTATDPTPQSPIAAAPTPGPTPAAPAPAPSIPTVTTVPNTISTVPPPPAVQATQAVQYIDVPGYYSEILGYTKSTGQIRMWHNYTSGTRKGDLVMAGVVANFPKNQTTPPAGWGAARVLSGHEDWESFQRSVQYEVTHQAAVTKP